jgi:hypothetical protein
MSRDWQRREGWGILPRQAGPKQRGWAKLYEQKPTGETLRAQLRSMNLPAGIVNTIAEK